MVVSFTSAPPLSKAAEAEAAGEAGALGQEQGREAPAAAEIAAVQRRDRHVPTAPELNRFLWNMRYPGARPLPGARKVLPGPIAPPARYTAESISNSKGATGLPTVNLPPSTPCP